jgi:hypothetical protein
MKSPLRLGIILFATNCALAIGAIHWAGCVAPQQRNTYHEPTEPGFYNIKGWGYSYVYFANKDSEGKAGDIDSDGTVGHPYTLGGPTTLAIPTHHWTATATIQSGTLPPGLTMNDDFSISGIPTERGHWIVTLHLADMITNGVTYYGFTQQVRFHITGSGEVNQ